MSIEAMSKAYEALNKSRPFDADNARMQRDAMDALRTAIQQAEAKTEEPVGYMSYSQIVQLRDRQVSHAYVYPTKDLSTVHPIYTHPAPGVPDDVVRDAERYRWLKDRNNKAQTGVGCWESDDHFTWLCDLDADAAIDAAMLAASSQKG